MRSAERRPIPRLQRSPGYLAAKVAQRGAALMAACLGREGLTGRQYGVLETVSQYPGLTQQEIAAALELDRTTVSELVDGLTAAGWLRRQPAAANRRANALNLTPEGRRLLARVRGPVDRTNDELTAALTPSEREQLVGRRLHSPPRAHHGMMAHRAAMRTGTRRLECDCYVIV